MIPAGEVLILDGATGTELGRRGADLSPPLWSANALTRTPELVAAVHADYLEAGAGAVTTNTFRTHARNVEKAGGDAAQATELTARAVRLARDVRDGTRPDALVLGSVAPLEECYRPEHAPDRETCRREHEHIMAGLLEAGVDGLLLETMGSAREASAAASAAQTLAPGRWMISFCTRSFGPPGVLLDGSPFVDLLPHVEGACAVGFNCVAAPAMAAQVELARRMLAGAAAIIAYANVSAHGDDGAWVESDAAAPGRYADYAAQWHDAGATIIGGCCGTTPQTIRAIVGRLTSSAGH